MLGIGGKEELKPTLLGDKFARKMVQEASTAGRKSTRWWQLKDFLEFSSRKLGVKMDPI